MSTYSFYIEDERYSVPTLLFVSAKDAREARRLARDELARSAQRLMVEVRENDRFLFRLVQPAPGRQGEGRIPG